MCKSCHPICFVDKRSNTMQFVCIGLKISDHDIINAMYLIEHFAFLHFSQIEYFLQTSGVVV